MKTKAGFSLVELMVGMTIGLLTVLVVVNVLGVADARRRTTTNGADAVTNAQLALYTVERDGKSAGYGLATVRSALGCDLHISYKLAQRPGSHALAPVQITDGPGGSADTLAFLNNLPGDVAQSTRIMLAHPLNDTGFFVQSDLAARTGDLMLAVPRDPFDPARAPTWCTSFAVTDVVAGANRFMHDGVSDWNMPVTSSIMPPAGYLAGDYLINLGRLRQRIYDINEASLRLRELDLAGIPIASGATASSAAGSGMYANIVQLQAVYGKDTNNDGVVDAWNATAPLGPAWQQVIALRVALVARSQKREPELVTADGAATCADPVPPPAALCWHPDPAAPAQKIDVSSVAG
ncbi:MAG: PilW family protein, partial [Janthinobacterium lividum]